MGAQNAGAPDVIWLMRKAQRAYRDWTNRNSLPEGVTADPKADLTLFYANNTIYGNEINLPTWTQRPGNIKVTLKNGDHFVQGYINVDSGGSRGWENQFQSSVKVGGTGCDFTFGRAHWWITAGGPWGTDRCAACKRRRNTRSSKAGVCPELRSLLSDQVLPVRSIPSRRRRVFAALRACHRITDPLWRSAGRADARCYDAADGTLSRSGNETVSRPPPRASRSFGPALCCEGASPADFRRLLCVLGAPYEKGGQAPYWG